VLSRIELDKEGYGSRFVQGFTKTSSPFGSGSPNGVLSLSPTNAKNGGLTGEPSQRSDRAKSIQAKA
jgi:hypothetical protein